MIRVESSPLLSIVVCTHNRSNLLRYCLRSLSRQTADPQQFEVLVVDNCSTDATQRIAGLYAGRHSHFRLLVETQLGLGFARNLGWRKARSAWVVYLDDDAVACADYVSRALSMISDHAFDCFGGRAYPWYKYGRPRWYRDVFVDNDKGLSQVSLLASDQFVDGMNCAFRRQTLKSLGGFPTGVGMRGRRISYGEEVLLQKRLRAAGGTVGFDPLLTVRHVVLPCKLRVAWLLRAAFAHGRDSWAIFEVTPSLRRVVGALLKAWLPLLRLPVALLRLGQHDYYLQNLCIELGTPMAHEWGRLAGALGRFRRDS